MRILKVVGVAGMLLLAATAVRADDYMTARGLYADCTAGMAPTFNAERIAQLRRCTAFIDAVGRDWVRSFPDITGPAVPCSRGRLDQWRAEHLPPNPELEAWFRKTLGETLYARTRKADPPPFKYSAYRGAPGPFVAYWEAEGLGPLGGWTRSARTAVITFLEAEMVICSDDAALKPVDPRELAVD